MTPEQADAILRAMQEIKTLLAGLEAMLKHQAVMAKYTGVRFSLDEEYNEPKPVTVGIVPTT